MTDSGGHEQGEMDFIPDDFPSAPGPALILLLGAVVVGILTGLVGTAFLLLLRKGDALRGVLTDSLHAWPPFFGWLAISILVAAAVSAAAWMVEKFAPTASGSGVPYVEKILRGGGQPRHAWVLPVKFLGGWLALSAGLVLGREGPLVQIGAVIGEKVGRQFPGLRGAWKSLMAAGAGAGLATAFNAPVGGTIFVLEEVFRKVTPLTFILTATAASVSVCLQRAVFHMPQDYAVPVIPEAPPQAVWLFFLFGLAIGILGVLYNRLLLAFLAAGAKWKTIPVPVRAAAIGFLMGSFAWFAPKWIGGGDDITQSILASRSEVWLLLGIASLRFFLGPLSYSAGTPGGLFAPIIALGAIVGAATGSLNHALLPALVPAPLAFAVAGMAAFFTATIRAPLTGIVICLEMTGCYSLFFPMLATCLGACLIPTLLKNAPIYDALAARDARRS
ncbi:MAG: H(+)/Cl(-) exchange transporter ClcA [Verrucomicrobia bacterium]|nr:H(+)/Cl(-) exchange transporter ClcA [Verrucomicrobiota bacterium]